MARRMDHYKGHSVLWVDGEPTVIKAMIYQGEKTRSEMHERHWAECRAMEQEIKEQVKRKE